MAGLALEMEPVNRVRVERDDNYVDKGKRRECVKAGSGKFPPSYMYLAATGGNCGTNRHRNREIV